MDRISLIQWTGIASTAICFSGALLLVSCSRGNRARKILAFTLFAWGLAYLYRLFALGGQGFVQFGVMAVPTLVVGHAYVILTMLYPIELSRPGWLDTGNALRLLLPFAGIVAFYFIGVRISGDPVRTLPSPADILHHFHEFNVWFRFILYLSTLAYIAYALTIVYLDEPRNRKWLHEHYASTARIDTSWLRYYGLGFSLITVSFLLVLLNNAPWNSLLHTILTQVFFALVTWKALLQNNPYPEGYFGGASPGNNPQPGPLDEIAHSQLFHHKVVVDEWLHREKPFLDPSFRIADIRSVVPLDEDQLARLFTLSYGEPFGTVVRKLRVAHSMRLLADASLPVEGVARASGFADENEFRRAFAHYEGITPEAYRHSYQNMRQ